MTEHLRAEEPVERTDQREGYRDGHYTPSMVARMGRGYPGLGMAPSARSSSPATSAVRRPWCWR